MTKDLKAYPHYHILMLEYFMDQLAEAIVLDPLDAMCSFCIRGSCDHQVSGLTCRNGVKAWLLERRTSYEDGLTAEIQKQFDYLDQLRASNETNLYGAVPYLHKQFPHWSLEWCGTVLAFWMGSFQERMEK